MRILWICSVSMLSAVSAFCETNVAADSPARVLIVDGYGNHDWQRTTRLIGGILGAGDGFVTEVSTVPVDADSSAYDGWKPDFARYDVVVQTCNDINGSGPLWPEKARLDFESFVAGGGGVFVFHSANNAFAKWEAYNRMIGLGWRVQDFGTAIRIAEDGSLVRIPPGSGAPTSHGARTDRVIHRMGEHPVHVGLPEEWMTPLIEVYTHARGPAEKHRDPVMGGGAGDRRALAGGMDDGLWQGPGLHVHLRACLA